VERAIEFEIARQTALIESGGKVVQETRGWNEDKGETFSQRLKEGSADYRYFPEPDLPKLMLSDIPEFGVEHIRADLPELPWEKRARYKALGIKEEDVAYVSATLPRSAFIDAVLKALATPELQHIAVNYMTSDIAGYFAKQGGERFESLDAGAFAKLVRMIGEHKVSSRGAKDILAVLLLEGGDPEDIMNAKGLGQISDPKALEEAVADVLRLNGKAVEEYKGGKQGALQYLIGASMKATKGAGNPALIKEIIERILA
jgi:aspartyl-tRNA(Asn)/glutamyl-tRNA(Gln) amidotransferase subunit B